MHEFENSLENESERETRHADHVPKSVKKKRTIRNKMLMNVVAFDGGFFSIKIRATPALSLCDAALYK